MRKKRFENMDGITTIKSWKDLKKWRKERRTKQKDLSFQVPIINNPHVDFIKANRSAATITWIGHSTFLIQINGINIITDPVWAKLLGTNKRLAPPGLQLHELPNIDVVLLSHSHYDHLHFTTIKKLPGNPLFLVPAGLAQSFNRKGFTNVRELQWWENIKLNEIEFIFVPAQHWTKRTLFDTNSSHWGGWIMTTSRSTIYFAGDSGYFRGFSHIGKTFAIDVALMPIGAYEPEWFMKQQHVSPEEAVQAFIDCKAKVMIPMHYGAFRLADDTPKEALDRLQAKWRDENLEINRLKIVALGETVYL